MEELLLEVLWIDDEPTEAFKDEAFEEGINITNCVCLNDGISLLKDNCKIWDAIILDANCKITGNEVEPDIEALIKAVKYLLKNNVTIPWFVYTAKSMDWSDELRKYINDDDRIWDDRDFYHKPSQRYELFANIKKAVEQNEVYKIRHRYADLFSWLKSPIYEEVLSILQIVENGDKTNADIFNKVRKILDWIMTELNTYGLLTIEFNGTNLNECSRFLASNELQEYIPQYIQRQIHSCSAIANEGSHRRVSDEDVKSGKAPYLIRSTVFELLNILVWMHQLPDDDATRRKITDQALNAMVKAKPEEPKNIPQKPEFDEELKVWHCGDCMLPIKFWEEGEVLLTEIAPNSSKNPNIKKKYPYFAKKYKTVK